MNIPVSEPQQAPPVHAPEAEPQVIDQPAAVPAGSKHVFTSVPDPKRNQLGGRATDAEFQKLKAIMALNGCVDIVRLALKCVKAAENDIFSPIKTKVKVDE